MHATFAGCVVARAMWLMFPSTLWFQLTHLKIANQPEEVKSMYFKHKLWIFGLVLIIVGSGADFIALGFAAQSIIAPLGSLTLVSNVFFAPLMLKESFGMRDIISTFAIVMGSSIAVLFASHEDTIYEYVFCPRLTL